MVRLILSCFPVLLVACGDTPPAEAPVETDSLTVETSRDNGERTFEVPRLPGDGVRESAYVGHLETLSSDEFEGRAPGTRGERLTLDYLVGEFRELGLEPGYGDSFLQPVEMQEINNEHRSDLVIGFDDGDDLSLSYPEEMIIWSRRPDSEHAIEDSELVFVGYGVVAPEYDWDDYEGLDVEGKTVVMLINDPGFASGDEDMFNGEAMTYYGRWTYKYEEAARQGAAGAIIVHETEPASYGWDVVANSWSGPQFELADSGDERLMAIEGWITDDSARELFARSDLDFDTLRDEAGRPGFDSVELDARASGDVRHRIREGTSYNVLAKVPGYSRPDEAIVYSAHWDHLGRNLAVPGGDGIYNGAIDNASGTAGLLEIARLFSEGPAPERSVLFAAVTLEEYGLLGSRHYVNTPVFPAADTVANLNMDALPHIGPTRDVVVVGHGNSELEEYLKAAVQTQDRKVVPEATPEAGFYYRSDHFNFAQAGIPALYAKGGIQHREKGEEYGREQAQDYTDNRYHQTSDEFDPDWDFRGVIEDLELNYLVGRMLADSEDWPEWYEGNEFKAVRDEQRP